MSEPTPPAPRSRAPRFSLRLLLALLLVCGLFFAWLSVRVRENRREQQAMQRMMDRASAEASVQEPLLAVYRSSWFGLQRNVVWLRIMSAPIPELAVELPHLTHLEDLQITDQRLTDAEMVHIGRCKNLRRLVIGYASITDAGLTHLAALEKLRELDLSATSVTDEGVMRLEKALPGLIVADD